MKNFVIVVYMSIFSLITPVGIGIGIAVTESSNVEGGFVAILQALAAGTLVYVVFFEVLEKERVKKHNLGSKKQLWCQLYGVIQVKLQNEKKKHNTFNIVLNHLLVSILELDFYPDLYNYIFMQTKYIQRNS